MPDSAPYSVSSRLTRFAPPPADERVEISASGAAPAEPAGSDAAPRPEFPGADPDLMVVPSGPARARSGVRGVLAGFGIRISPGAAERATLESDARLLLDEEVIRQATWTRAISVLVANPKGGVGKTPVSLLLAGTLASVRGGSVCVVEVSDDPGALTYRAEGSPSLGLGELVKAVSTVTSAGQLAGYTAPQTSFASVIGSVGARPSLGRDDVIAVSAVIDSFYSVRVMDSGNQASSSAFAAATDSADALVVPVLNSGDAVFEALSLLERLRREGGRSKELADRAIMLRLTDGRPEHPQVLERIDRIIAGAGVARVFAVPYDSHIAERGQLTLGRLDPATYRVFAAAAASIVRSVRVPVPVG